MKKPIIFAIIGTAVIAAGTFAFFAYTSSSNKDSDNQPEYIETPPDPKIVKMDAKYLFVEIPTKAHVLQN